MNTIQKYQKSSSFRAFLKNCRDTHHLRLELPAYLIMPVQRIPRYILLLQDLIKRTPANFIELPKLSSALQKLKKEADLMNERKRETEKLATLLDIEMRLSSEELELVKPGRQFILQEKPPTVKKTVKKNAKTSGKIEKTKEKTKTNRVFFIV